MVILSGVHVLLYETICALLAHESTRLLRYATMNSNTQQETVGSMLRGGGVIGSWCGFASFANVEAMTLAGFDFLVLGYAALGVYAIPLSIDARRFPG